LKYVLLALIGLATVAGNCQGGTGTASDESRHYADNELTVFSAATFANSGFHAQESRSKLYLLGMRYGKRLYGKRLFGVSYTPELIPMVFVSQPVPQAALTTPGLRPQNMTHSSFGPAFSPGSHRLQPFMGGHAVFIYFGRNEPSALAAQSNFIGDGEVGLRIPLKSRKALTMAYRFHHFSNGFMARDNPGVDSQMLFIGFTITNWPSRIRSHPNRYGSPRISYL
jgi:hypothetical protein